MKSIVNHNTIEATNSAHGALLTSGPGPAVFAMSRFRKRYVSAVLRNLKVGLGLAATIAGGLTAASATAQTPPSITWCDWSQYDEGIETSIAYAGSQFMEVHSSQWEPSLWYHYGYIDSNNVQHTGPSIQYDSGQWPKISMNSKGTAVEVHNDAAGIGTLWYHVISCNPSAGATDFGGSVFFDYGSMPCVAVNNNNVVVEEQIDVNGFHCHVGTVNAGTARVGWSPAQNVADSGQSPAISVNDSGVVVEVHGAESGNLLYYRVGRVNGSNIVWGPSTQFDSGFYPSVALTNSGTVVEVHLASYTWGSLWMGCDNLIDDFNALYESTGVVVGNQIVWSNPVIFDEGFQPSVATNGLAVLESHTSGSASYDANLWMSWGAFN